MTAFKAFATRRLREAELCGLEDEMWAEHGSTIYVWNGDQLHEVCMYVRFGQGRDL